jgi:phosphatidylserine/phosphatidylglycerophosphate/cardiolipin synthase-like enzyme
VITRSTDELARCVAELVRDLPEGSVDRLLTVLDALPLSRSALRECFVNPMQADRLERALALLDRARIDENYRELSAIVRGARAMSRHSDAGEAVELVWTGPNPLTSALYRTEQTLLDLIASAHRTLLIVTFAAYKVIAVREALANAAARGVRVTVVAEQAEEDGGKLSFAASPALTTPASTTRFYVWPRNARPTDQQGRCGSLHVKCASADDDRLLVSSANLTAFALELNMELGVLVRGGPTPRRVREHFERMIREGILVEIR